MKALITSVYSAVLLAKRRDHLAAVLRWTQRVSQVSTQAYTSVTL